MVRERTTTCPKCSGQLKHYDSVFRITRTKGGMVHRIRIRRLRCGICQGVHRELPNYIIPHKQYEAEVVHGVLEGLIVCETTGFEDYPCEMTMIRWRTQNLNRLLWGSQKH